MIAASEWYASATFWAAAGVAVAVLTGSALAIVSYMAAFPRRRLLYSMPLVVPVTATPEGAQGDLELLRNGARVADPYIVELHLVSRGRRDIPSSAYDGGEPLKLSIGAQIFKLLNVRSTPPFLSPPKLTVGGNILKIGPNLIGKSQRIVITLLTEGRPSTLKCASSLIDVQISNRFADEEEWVLEHRLMIGCISWPLVYVGFGVAWAISGPTVGLIVLLISSLAIRAILLAVLAIRRKALRLPSDVEAHTI